MAKHERAAAFGGSDGQAYSVAIYVEDEADVRGLFGASLLFVRWSSEGERAVGHLETEYLAFATSPDDARAPLLELPLTAVKMHLDRCIARASETAQDS